MLSSLFIALFLSEAKIAMMEAVVNSLEIAAWVCYTLPMMRKISYGKQTILQEDIDAVVSVLQSDFLTQGPQIKVFENLVAAYHGAKYGVAFSNGTAALHGAYYAAGVTAGDEVITSPITFVATANAAIYCGAKPVLVDIDPETNCIGTGDVERAMTERTKAIAPVSFAGYPVDLKSCREIADRNHCVVIHDAAHAIGSKRDGTFGMAYAHMAILSFHPVKHIAAGEGGMVLTNDEAYYQKLLRFRTHGITKDPALLSEQHGPWYYEMIELGFNYRMTEMQAALGSSQFRRIDENLRQRNETAKLYVEAFSCCEDLLLPPSMGFDILNCATPKQVHAYHLYTLRLRDAKKRLDFYNYLHENGILAQIHYIPLHLQPYYQAHFGYKAGDFPQAEAYYESEISIPMYHNMGDVERQFVIETIRKYRSRG